MAWPDDALSDLVNAIGSGSQLEVPDYIKRGFAGRYSNAFLVQSEGDWPPIKAKILRLGNLVGSVAETLTRAKALDLGGPTPELLDADCAFHAGQMVREEVCPPLGPEPGVWCAGYPVHAIGGSKDFMGIVASVRRSLKNLSVRSLSSREEPISARIWTVEGALSEVILAIESGSRLPIERDTKDELMKKYRYDFEAEYRTGDHDWNDYRDRVLLLARLVGSLASTLTFISKAIEDKGEVPIVTDPRLTYLAGFLVAENICPPGVWCDQYSLGADSEADIISTAFKLIIQLLREY